MGQANAKPPLSGDDFKCVWVSVKPLIMAELSIKAGDRSSPPDRNRRLAIAVYAEIPGSQPHEPHPWGMLVHTKHVDGRTRRVTFSRTSNTKRSELGLSHTLKDHGHDCEFINKDGIIQTSESGHFFAVTQEDFLRLSVKCDEGSTWETQKILGHLKGAFPQNHISVREGALA